MQTPPYIQASRSLPDIHFAICFIRDFINYAHDFLTCLHEKKVHTYRPIGVAGTRNEAPA
jgi:hypothetical protein